MKKVIKKAILVLCFISPLAMANEEPKQITPPPAVAAAADVGTTILALGRGATELNPLGLVGSTVAKGVYFIVRDELPEHDKNFFNRVVTSVWSGAAVNNLIVFTGGITAVALPVGLLVGVALYIYNSDDDK
jgi:hypothetical protein